MIICSFCDKEAAYVHRYVDGLFFCEAHKYYHVTMNHFTKKMSNRVMIKIDEDDRETGETNENKC